MSTLLPSLTLQKKAWLIAMLLMKFAPNHQTKGYNGLQIAEAIKLKAFRNSQFNFVVSDDDYTLLFNDGEVRKFLRSKYPSQIEFRRTTMKSIYTYEIIISNFRANELSSISIDTFTNELITQMSPKGGFNMGNSLFSDIMLESSLPSSRPSAISTPFHLMETVDITRSLATVDEAITLITSETATIDMTSLMSSVALGPVEP